MAAERSLHCGRAAGRELREVYRRLLTRLSIMTAHRMIKGRHSPGGPLLSVAEAGEYLGTGERFIRRLITERRISYVKVGKYVRLERSTLDAFVDAGRVHSQR